ncbi:DUF177 domain-containing protein [Hydrogenophaga sp.]|uniref:YceD family protein n=1 Tax=Hydrogenophaga sp. TaxID=1904254 RepID=UPI0035697371
MKETPKSVWNPARLDVKAFAQAGARLQMQDPLERFERLQQELHQPEDPVGMPVSWTIQAELRPGAQGGAPAAWLHLEADARVALTCQRCLGPVEAPLQVDNWFRFVADEATAEAQDDDCEEDLLALEPRPSLLDVLEDELLMALPIVPMHETCPHALVMQAGDPAVPAADDAQERPHPFAGLARLKK